MRKVKLRTLLAGPGITISPGQTVSLDDETAKALIAGGFAEAVDDPVQPVAPPLMEVAAVEPAETAISVPRKRGRRRK